ncbi:Dolichyl-phosphate-mannose-protein mannosyltransferase, putative [Trichomonas vaginalis G3]|uniref:Dolichyl-phosphate-mannose-protein mannosyltransferase, putative n=1 Tax=Trichomonas vaginalis (strain ATCC PRA-98 / G3) TaxID=412133 RepID=A2EFN9_TRIV3|nr:dolichyl-phosphate-mannose-protein mannosyltransferase protein [Trichomonas vaginalis G3]EAY08534.1 Dolichyl-phosphate-mannose-protein mannosyltransferase, putative [Trichomonas vaginalis G3]KAI5542095.1 dolichyl-phosphate-mannose-protein mannosyltransferase protein [Trichomonas vaginalis G3]|eukprot:XP_001320757.1 Dolichyl-phosphate-mannose-protein mannosyltransferase [Trichomonas vaginalis G3]
MAGIAYLTQYPGNINWGYKDIQGYDDNETNYINLRLTPSVFSSFCSVLIYCSMRNLGFSISTATAASFLTLFDITSIVEGRFILSDGMLHFFSCLHIFAFTLFLRKTSFLRTLFAGITLGFAFSCKLTAGGLILLDGLSQFIWLLKKRRPIAKIIARASLLLVPCFSIHLICWIIHFDILKFKDNTGGAYSEEGFSQYLYNPDIMNITYKGWRLQNRNHLKTIFEDLVRTHHANMRITNPHPWSSMPINWPFLLDKYVMFYSDVDYKSIRCHGSPMTYWSSSVFLILTPLLLFTRKLDWRIIITFFGWAFSYLPFIMVPRAMYLYHYIVPMFFASMNLAAVSECVLKNWPKISLIFNIVICVLSVTCTMYFAPWVYGYRCMDCDEKLGWIRRWEFGPPDKVNFFGIDSINTTLITGSFV